MANNIKNIIDELSTIATAFTEVNTFNFGKRSEINNKPAKSYPVIYVSHEISAKTIERDVNSHLPKKREYPLQVIFYDTYKIANKATTDLQTKYSELEIVADKFWAEVNRRTIEDPASTREFYIENFEDLTGDYQLEVHDGDLISITYTPVFRADNLQCTTGTFNY